MFCLSRTGVSRASAVVVCLAVLVGLLVVPPWPGSVPTAGAAGGPT
jgi:hypothetical protein